jgi:hypothetical protein
MLSVTRTALESKSLANLGKQTWKLDDIPDRDSAGIHYIDRVEFNVAISALTQGGGGAASPLAQHNILGQITMNANDGKAWGPNNVNAQTVDESRYLATGKPLPFARDINGDANVAAGAGPVTRAFRVVFDFDAYGRPGTYTPPASYFKNGSITSVLAVPANNTTLTGTIQVVVYTHGEPKLRAVPRIELTANNLNSKDFTWQGSGVLLQAFLESSADVVAADITNLTMKGSGGFEIMSQVDILASRSESYVHNPEVAASNLLRHFCDPVGGTTPRAVPVFPATPTYEGIQSLPSSDKYTSKLVGAPTITNYAACTVVAAPMSTEEGNKQLIAQGADRDAIASTMHDVPGGVVHNDRLKSFIPKVVSTPSVVK